MFCVFWDTFLGLLPGACFLSFSVFFGATFGSFLVPKLGLGVVFDAAKNNAKTGFGGIPGNFRKWGGVPYNNLWSVAVLGHSASWSLVVAKGQGGSGWQLVTPCARSAVADH